MEKAKLDTTYFSAECVDGIVEIQYKGELYLTLELAQDIVAKRLSTFADRDYPYLLKSSRLKGMNRAARKYFFAEGLKNMNAMAMVPDNKVGQMLTTFLIAFERPPIPCKVFRTHDEAREWLKNFVR